jgi:hypothetical protein
MSILLIVLITAIVAVVWSVVGPALLDFMYEIIRSNSSFITFVMFFIAGPIIWVTLVAMLVMISRERESID